MRYDSRLLCFVCLVPLAACGGDDDDGGSDPDAGPDAAAGSSWQPLLTGEWSLEPGSEDWYCVTKTFDEDVYIGAFRPIDPVGTHHTLMTYGPPDGPDHSAMPCDPNTNSENAVYASGINTNALELPAGVGFKIAAGQQINLNLHVFNVTDAMLSGESGVEILALSADAVEEEAEMFLPGAFGFEIPRDEEYSYSSGCDITEEQHVFALFPHMHQLGRHFKTELTVGGVTTALWDEDYRFAEQTFTSFEPIALGPGDRITTTCTWYLPADPGLPDVVRWGNSSNDEMCYSIMMRYPRITGPEDSIDCTDESIHP